MGHPGWGEKWERGNITITFQYLIPILNSVKYNYSSGGGRVTYNAHVYPRSHTVCTQQVHVSLKDAITETITSKATSEQGRARSSPKSLYISNDLNLLYPQGAGRRARMIHSSQSTHARINETG